jgi:hypothetical protein
MLLRHSRRLPERLGAEASGRELQRLGRLAAAVRICRLRVPEGLGGIGSVCEALVADAGRA